MAKWAFVKPAVAYMKTTFIRQALPALAFLALLLPGCGSVSLWPFGGDNDQGRTRAPSDATEYQCAGGKRFYVRNLDNGGAAWIIFPDREFRLDKAVSAAGTRYSNGITTLDINGNEATLADGPAIAFAGCKAAAK